MTRSTLTSTPTHSQVGKHGAARGASAPSNSPRLPAAHVRSPDRPNGIEPGQRQLNRMLTRPQVERRTGLARSTLYRMMRAGRFPLPRRIGLRAVRWPESEIETWIETRPRSNGFGSR